MDYYLSYSLLFSERQNILDTWIPPDHIFASSSLMWQILFFIERKNAMIGMSRVLELSGLAPRDIKNLNEF